MTAQDQWFRVEKAKVAIDEWQIKADAEFI